MILALLAPSANAAKTEPVSPGATGLGAWIPNSFEHPHQIDRYAHLVGHQPVIGQAIARLLNGQGGSRAVRKGAVWWLRTRERDGHGQTVVVAVQSPETV